MTTFRESLWKALRSTKFFPDSLDIEEQCIAIRRAENDSNALAKIKAHEEAFLASGEPRTNVAELIREALSKRGITIKEKQKAAEQVSLCPHCQMELPITSNIRFWSVTELREYADTLEGLQAQAAQRRAEHMEALKNPAEVVEGIA